MGNAFLAILTMEALISRTCVVVSQCVISQCYDKAPRYAAELSRSRGAVSEASRTGSFALVAVMAQRNLCSRADSGVS